MDGARDIALLRLQRPGIFHAWLSYCGLTPLLRPAWRKAARLARNHLPQGARVLDYGCGSGGLTLCLAAQNFCCTAVEWNAWLLHETGRHLSRRKAWGEWEGEAQTEVMLADHMRLPLRDKSFDLAVSFLSLHGRSAEDRELMLDEMRRLAPLAMLLDWQMPERNLAVPAALFSSSLARLVYGLTGLIGLADLAGVGTDTNSRAQLKEYFARGAFEAVLYGLRDRSRTVARESCLGGSMGLALLAWT